jgi:hypothetical protein
MAVHMGRHSLECQNSYQADSTYVFTTVTDLASGSAILARKSLG